MLLKMFQSLCLMKVLSGDDRHVYTLCIEPVEQIVYRHAAFGQGFLQVLFQRLMLHAMICMGNPMGQDAQGPPLASMRSISSSKSSSVKTVSVCLNRPPIDLELLPVVNALLQIVLLPF